MKHTTNLIDMFCDNTKNSKRQSDIDLGHDLGVAHIEERYKKLFKLQQERL